MKGTLSQQEHTSGDVFTQLLSRDFIIQIRFCSFFPILFSSRNTEMLWSKIIFVFKSWKVSILLLCTLFELNCFGRQIKKEKLQGEEILSNHNSGWEVSSPLEWNVSFGKSLISYVDAPSSIYQSSLKFLYSILISPSKRYILRGRHILKTQNFSVKLKVTKDKTREAHILRYPKVHKKKFYLVVPPNSKLKSLISYVDTPIRIYHKLQSRYW